MVGDFVLENPSDSVCDNVEAGVGEIEDEWDGVYSNGAPDGSGINDNDRENDGVAVGDEVGELDALEIRDSVDNGDDPIEIVAVGEGVAELVALGVRDPDDDALSLRTASSVEINVGVGLNEAEGGADEDAVPVGEDPIDIVAVGDDVGELVALNVSHSDDDALLLWPGPSIGTNNGVRLGEVEGETDEDEVLVSEESCEIVAVGVDVG